MTMADPLEAYLVTRQAIVAERIGDGGLATCERLTSVLDAAVAAIADRVVVNGGSFAVVAVGGYGRGEICVHSDVDLMLLHDGIEVDQVANTVFYPLWDANLRVGHSVRTPQECASLARDNFETLTSLLSARLVAGDPKLLAMLDRVLADVMRGKPLTHRLAEAERERRSLDPYPVLAADTKSGRGGLRTFQSFGWERRRAELLGLETDPESEEERDARSALLAIRNGLHAISGRCFDEYAIDMRAPVARWLGMEPAAATRMLCAALRTGDRLAAARWPDLTAPSSDVKGSRAKRALRSLRSKLGRETNHRPAAQRPLPLVVDAITRPGGVWLDGVERRRVSADPATEWTSEDRTAFLQLLAAGHLGRVALGLLEELGWLERAFPEWLPLVAAPQADPFHEHPVDSHSWRTVDEITGLGTGDEPWLHELVAEFAAPDTLRLAAFLHDIGKGRGGDHCEEGTPLATAFLTRAGFPAEVITDVATAVRYHLLIPQVASREDIGDPAVITKVKEIVGSRRTLIMLTLLTVADSRATGAGMWTKWKSTLVRTLYMRTADAFEADAFDTAGGAGVTEASIGQAPLDVAAPPATGDERIVVHEGPDATTSRVVVTGQDRLGFLAAVAGTFALHNVSVLDARLVTRPDGVVMDTFHVTDSLEEAEIPADRWKLVEADLSAALRGELDLREAVRRKAKSYRSPQPGIATDVTVRSDADRTTVTVSCSDRVGRLFDIVDVLAEHGLDVNLAKIDTRGPEVHDVFHAAPNEDVAVDELTAALRRRLDG